MYTQKEKLEVDGNFYKEEKELETI